MADATRQLRRLLAPGYRLEGRAGHLAVIDPAGRELRTPDGRPFRLPCSPQRKGGSWKDMLLQLDKAGALKKGGRT